jgi:hypothetical protein
MRKALVRLIKSEALKLPHALVGMMVVLTFACAPLRALAQGAGGVVQGVGSAAMRGAKQAGENAAGQMMQNMESAMMSPSAAASPGAAQSSAVSGQSAAAASLPNAPSVPSMTGAPSLPSVPNPSTGTESERNIGGSIARFRLPADSARFNFGGIVWAAILCFSLRVPCSCARRPAPRAKPSEEDLTRTEPHGCVSVFSCMSCCSTCASFGSSSARRFA